jgi:choline dehydrogenase
MNLSADKLALKKEAEKRMHEWETTGKGIISSSMNDAAAFFSTGLGDTHSHDAQISCLITNGDDGSDPRETEYRYIAVFL